MLRTYLGCLAYLVFCLPLADEAKPLMSEGCASSRPVITSNVEAAAKAGDPQAQLQVERAAFFWSNTSASDQELAGWLEKGASLGQPEAQYLFGYYEILHATSERDYISAASWNKKAADQGYVPAIESFGVFLFWGKGVPQNKQEGLRLLSKAAELGCVRADVLRGELIMSDDHSSKNAEIGFGWIKHAADAGDSAGMVQMALCYLFGLGTQRDVETARQVLEAVYKKGDEFAPQAANSLGVMYMDGQGVQKDDLKAIRWMEAAAPADVDDTRQRLAVLLERAPKEKLSTECGLFDDATLLTKEQARVSAGESVVILSTDLNIAEVALKSAQHPKVGYMSRQCFTPQSLEPSVSSAPHAD